MPTIGDLDDLGHALVALLSLERRVRDRPWDRVVLLAGDDQQRPAFWVLGVDFRLGPRVEIGGRGLKERCALRRHSERLVEVLGLLLADGVAEGEVELLERERDRTVAVGRVVEDRPGGLQC